MKQIIALFILTFFISACSSKKDVIPANEEQIDLNERELKRENRRNGPPNIEEVFKMDIDKDGLLSKSEVTGRLLERFGDIDSDADGFISKTEFENAPRPKRKQGGRTGN